MAVAFAVGVAVAVTVASAASVARAVVRAVAWEKIKWFYWVLSSGFPEQLEH